MHKRPWVTSIMNKQLQSFLVLVVVLLCSVSNGNAAGFALIEQSASGIGNAFAGAAATAEDASTIFFNPAGMTYLPDNQLVLAGHAIRSDIEFNNKKGTGKPSLRVKIGVGAGILALYFK